MSNTQPSKSRVFYALQNTKNWFGNIIKTIITSKKFWLFVIFMLAISIQSRGYLQQYVLVMREYTFAILVVILTFVISLYFMKKSVKWLWFLPVAMLACTMSFIYFGGQQYVALYLKYNTLEKLEMTHLPVSNKVMPQPLNSVHILAKQKVSETEELSKPDRVIFGNDVHWVMEITPDYFWGKFGATVNELYSVSGTTPSPDFSKREKVCFNVGEGLVFSSNSYNAAIKSLNPWQYMSYFPVNVRYMPNDQGKIVQVISLAKWDGFFFPTIEFGGVIVIEQNCEENIFQETARLLVGSGDYISPEKIKNHAYLKKQNLVPYNVYRYMASSFRYQEGFFGPLRVHHKGDIRIPDMPDDQNEQPFVQYFDEVGEENLSGLFATFALEPYKKESQGLAISVFIPGDSMNTVHYYHHANKQEGLTGSTAMAGKVKDKKKDYKWGETVRAVESKLYIRDIAGKRRVYFQTVVAVVDGDGNMAGSEPEIAVTDAAYNTVTFVDVTKSVEDWDISIAENNAIMYSKETKTK